MKLLTHPSQHHPHPAQCFEQSDVRRDVRRFCGPKFNTFGPASESHDEPGRFFQREAWKAMTKPVILDDESDRWEGME